jgi:hypothetical protein
MLLHKTPFLNPNVVCRSLFISRRSLTAVQIADVMVVFGIVDMSLGTGQAVHEVLPKSLLDRVFYHWSLSPHPVTQIQSGKRLDQRSTNSLSDDPLDQLKYHSVEYAYYATGCAAAYQIILALDELHGLVRDLCGEVPLRGFERWKREFETEQVNNRV